MKEVIVLDIKCMVVEFNEHYCVVQYDNDRKLKFYKRDEVYTTVENYLKTLNK